MVTDRETVSGVDNEWRGAFSSPFRSKLIWEIYADWTGPILQKIDYNSAKHQYFVSTSFDFVK